MDFIRELIATRGTQLVARYAAIGITALAGYLGATVDVNGTATAVASLVVAGVLFAFDHYSHAKQEQK